MSDIAQPATDAGSRAWPVPNALVAAAFAAPVALVVSLPGLVFLAGSDRLAYGLGLLAGVVLAGLLVAPAIAATGASTLIEAVDRRFGRLARAPALAVVILAVLPLLAIEVTVAANLSEALLAIPFPVAATVTLALSAIAALEPAMARWLGAVAYLLLVGTFLTLFFLLASKVPDTASPLAAHASALESIRMLEEQLIEAGRVDFDTFAVHATPFASMDRLNVAALVVSLALGVAVMPPLLAALSAVGYAPRRCLTGAWTAFFVMLLVLPVAPVAVLSKLAIYEAMRADTPLTKLPAWLEAPLDVDAARIHGTSTALLRGVARAAADGASDPAAIGDHLARRSLGFNGQWTALPPEVQAAIITSAGKLGTSGANAWAIYQSEVLPAAARSAGNEGVVLTQAALAMDPIALWLALPELSGAPAPVAPLMVAGPVLAISLMSAALIRVLVTLGPPGTLRGMRHARALTLAAAAVAGIMAAFFRPSDTIPIVVGCLSLVAAGLFPVLAIGLAWKRTTAIAAALSIATGAGVALTYDVGIQVFPASFYRTWPALSNAGEYAIEELATRERAWRSAETGAAKVAAKQALDDWARGTPARPGAANWFGIDSASGAFFGVPVGLSILVLATLATGVRRREPGPQP